ncbi:MAG: glycoside hydrolase family 5 protein [Verrucomicrobiota bacterium]
MRALLIFILSGAVLAEEFPLRMATEARMQLIVPPNGEPLEEVEVSLGSIGRGSWLENEGQRDRLADISFPIDWWRWREASVSFTPASDGMIDLHLTGPWRERSPGELFRQEVLWDKITVEGTSIENGAFGKMDGWESPWREYPSGSDWPLAGKQVGASWHGRPLVQKLKVKKGRRVVLSLVARAATIPGFNEPARLPQEGPAHRMHARMKRGVNLGNCWEATQGEGTVRFQPRDIDRIASLGFDHIRVPVGWHFRIENGEISKAFLDEMEPVLKRALDRNLVVMLDWHSFHELTGDPEGKRGEFIDGWRQIAAHFSGWPPELLFELLNEPSDGLEGELLNEIHAEAIAAIRESNPQRVIVLNPGSWSSSDMLGALRMPDDDNRIIVSIHCYDPFKFTHQGASWVGLEEVNDVKFPGTLPREFERRFDDAIAWSKYFGRPVHLGEFGAYGSADLESRRRYARAVRSAAESRGIPWCWWEWKAGFGCWDGTKNEPVLIDALIK